MRVTVIHNPTAGTESISRSELEAILRDVGYHVRYQTTKGRWKKVLQEPTDLVIAAGGDGTVRKVATQLAETTGPHVPFAIAPFGTANNFARSQRIDGDIHALVRRWSHAEPHPIDLGVVTVRRRPRYFLEGAGGGILATGIARGRDEVETRATHTADATRLALDLLRRLTDTAEPGEWDIELDGQHASGRYLVVEALNIGLVGPNVTLAPRADVSDGQLDLVTIDGEARSGLRARLHDRADGRSARDDGIEIRRFRHARLVPPHGWSFHVDDRSRPWRGEKRSVAIEIAVRPAAVSLVR